jgi:hypothetical protein
VSETQEQADKHVDSIASLLESERIAEYCPAMAHRMVGKYGSSKGGAATGCEPRRASPSTPSASTRRREASASRSTARTDRRIH